jgi:hypothetical protein
MKRPEVDEFELEEDWALAKTAARLAAPQRNKTRRVSNFQLGEIMPEPP